MSIEQKIDELESASVSALLTFLLEEEPTKPLLDKAKIAQGSFASVQRRKSAENQREALAYMMGRDQVPALAEGRAGARSSSKRERAG